MTLRQVSCDRGWAGMEEALVPADHLQYRHGCRRTCRTGVRVFGIAFYRLESTSPTNFIGSP